MGEERVRAAGEWFGGGGDFKGMTGADFGEEWFEVRGLNILFCGGVCGRSCGLGAGGCLRGD